MLHPRIIAAVVLALVILVYGFVLLTGKGTRQVGVGAEPPSPEVFLKPIANESREDRLDRERLLLEIRKTQLETEKLRQETLKLHAETEKIKAETRQIEQEAAIKLQELR